MTHLEILCYAIAHIDHLKEEEEKRKLEILEIIKSTGGTGWRETIFEKAANAQIDAIDEKKEQLKTMYKIECGSEYAE
jgi:hypothetical protein